jgi:hypothetical protein
VLPPLIVPALPLMAQGLLLPPLMVPVLPPPLM